MENKRSLVQPDIGRKEHQIIIYPERKNDNDDDDDVDLVGEEETTADADERKYELEF